MGYFDRLHGRVLRELGDITDEESFRPSIYWEKVPMTVQFRLHRFDSHLRQHTIQMEKALVVLAGSLSESRRLLRLIYAALAEAEGALLNAPDTGIELQQAAVEEITGRSEEIARSIMEGR
jgi:hypothetical protein